MSKKICFISPLAYPVLANLSSIESAGGSQTQVSLIAKELLRYGWDVSFLVGDYGQNSVKETINGIKIYKVFTPFSGLKATRFLKCITPLRKVLEEIKPEVCFTRGEVSYIGHICHTSMKMGIKLIFSTSHMCNCSQEGLKSIPYNMLIRKLYTHYIKKVDFIVTQSNEQKELIKKSFGVDSKVIHTSGYRPEVNGSEVSYKKFIWVGSIVKRKQPELFIKLARSLPDLKFKMIGGSYHNDRSYINHIKSMADGVSNLEFAGFIRDSDEKRYYFDAIALVNTSSKEGEGFPNVFVESWAYGKPVVSLHVDPDNIIEHKRLGYVSHTFDKLVRNVQKMPKSRNYIEMGRNAVRHFDEHHDINVNIHKYIEILDRLVR